MMWPCGRAGSGAWAMAAEPALPQGDRAHTHSVSPRFLVGPQVGGCRSRVGDLPRIVHELGDFLMQFPLDIRHLSSPSMLKTTFRRHQSPSLLRPISRFSLLASYGGRPIRLV